MDNIIELKGIGKSFDGSEYIVRDFNLTIKPGEFVTLLGPVRMWKNNYFADDCRL